MVMGTKRRLDLPPRPQPPRRRGWFGGSLGAGASAWPQRSQAQGLPAPQFYACPGPGRTADQHPSLRPSSIHCNSLVCKLPSQASSRHGAGSRWAS